MATGRGRRNTPLVERLHDEPYRFDIEQAARILELMRPGSRAVGTGSVPEDEAVQFSAAFGSGFPASEIDRVELPDGKEGPARVTVNFLGLAGHHGPLPEPFVALVQRRSIQKDHALRDFLDLFNHRLISLFLRIKRKHSPVLDPRAPHEGHFARYLLSLLGLGTSGLGNRLGVPDRALLHYAGLLSNRPRPASALLAALRHYLRVPVQYRPFQGGWYHLAEDQTTVLGQDGRNQALGGGAVLGSKVWQQDWRFELSLGPMSRAMFLDLLPNGRGHAALMALVRFHVGHERDFDIRLCLAGDDIPAAALTTEATGSRLGWTSFLPRSARVERDGQVVLRSSARHLEHGLTAMHVISGKLNSVCRAALERAVRLAITRTHYFVEIEHLLLALLDDPHADLAALMSRFGISADRLRRDLSEAIVNFRGGSDERPGFSTALQTLLSEAWVISASDFELPEVRSGAVIIALTHRDDLRQKVLISALALLDLRYEAASDLMAAMAGSVEAPAAAEPGEEQGEN